MALPIANNCSCRLLCLSMAHYKLDPVHVEKEEKKRYSR